MDESAPVWDKRKGDNVMKWTYVEDGLPDDIEQEYILCISGKRDNVLYQYATVTDCNYEDEKWYMNGYAIDTDEITVHAWMPIPDGPMLKYDIMFDKIVNVIASEEYRTLFGNLRRTIPDYFYKAPASSTGKYHPEYALGEGGLVRHTIATVQILMWLMESEELTTRERDLMIIAAAMHDTRKLGNQKEYEQISYTKFEHPMLAAAVVRSLIGQGFDHEDLDFIAKAIESHMGRWNTNKYSDVILPIPQTKYQRLLHQADYLASRKQLEFIFEEEL